MGMTRIILALGLLVLSSCGVVRPGTPGHEPPDGDTNPVTGARAGTSAGSGR